MSILEKYIQYAKDNPNGYWFKRRPFGRGWVPVKWQGWAVLLVYLAGVVSFALTLDEASPPREIAFTFLLPIAFLTALLIRICYKTGETPRWSWGFPDEIEHS